MVYAYRYEKDMLVVEIDERKEHLPELDIHQFILDIHDLNTSAKSQVILDLKIKKQFNSSDLGALIKTKDGLFEDGIELLLMNPSENVLELIKIVGLNDFFGIYNG